MRTCRCANRLDARVEELIYLGDQVRIRVDLCGNTNFTIKTPISRLDHRCAAGTRFASASIQRTCVRSIRCRRPEIRRCTTSRKIRGVHPHEARQIHRSQCDCRAGAGRRQAAASADITVISFGGANQKAQAKAFYEPFDKSGAGKVLPGEYNGEQAKIKAMVEAAT